MCSFQEKNISSLPICGNALTLQTAHGNFLILCQTVLLPVTAWPLKGYENSKLTSIRVCAKGEELAGTIQLSKYVVYTRCSQSLRKLYPNVEMMKTKCPKCLRLTFLPSKILSNKIWFRQSLYTILIIEICYNRKIHEK